jgi:hypothetical protein
MSGAVRFVDFAIDAAQDTESLNKEEYINALVIH